MIKYWRKLLLFNCSLYNLWGNNMLLRKHQFYSVWFSSYFCTSVSTKIRLKHLSPLSVSLLKINSVGVRTEVDSNLHHGCHCFSLLLEEKTCESSEQVALFKVRERQISQPDIQLIISSDKWWLEVKEKWSTWLLKQHFFLHKATVCVDFPKSQYGSLQRDVFAYSACVWKKELFVWDYKKIT